MLGRGSGAPSSGWLGNGALSSGWLGDGALAGIAWPDRGVTGCPGRADGGGGNGGGGP